MPGLCPGISGYCSESYSGQRCNFACSIGPAINSVCSQDGTWTPYPTCMGDIRETQDGCVSCPGPNGRPRNRTAEAILGIVSHNPLPAKAAPSVDSQGRVVRPSFAGNQAFGVVGAPQPFQRQPAPVSQPPVFREQTSQAPVQARPPPVFIEQSSQAPVFREPQQAFAPQPKPQQAFAPQPQQAFALSSRASSRSSRLRLILSPSDRFKNHATFPLPDFFKELQPHEAPGPTLASRDQSRIALGLSRLSSLQRRTPLIPDHFQPSRPFQSEVHKSCKRPESDPARLGLSSLSTFNRASSTS